MIIRYAEGLIHARNRPGRNISSGSRNRHNRRRALRPVGWAILARPPVFRIDPRIVTSALVGVAGAFVGYHIALLAFGGRLVSSVIAAAVGAAVVLFAWRMTK
jgi:hypothetical protein